MLDTIRAAFPNNQVFQLHNGDIHVHRVISDIFQAFDAVVVAPNGSVSVSAEAQCDELDAIAARLRTMSL